MKRIAPLQSLLMAALCGCYNVSYIQHESVPAASELRADTMRYTEVLDRFGAPIALANAPGGFAMFYERIQIIEGALGLKFSAVGYFGGSKGTRDYHAALLLFDEDGVLRQVFARNSKIDTDSGLEAGTGGGGAATAKDYGAGPSPLAWGQRKLNPLPVLLNDRWGAIEVGQGGFELFDTPRDAGQHTLSKPVPLAFKYFNK